MFSYKPERNIQSRRQLFDFLQSQMQTSFINLQEKRRLLHESSLIKSYIFEVNVPEAGEGISEKWLKKLFTPSDNSRYQTTLLPTNEDAFFQLKIKIDNRELFLYIDAATDPRFWLAYSISESQILDRWLDNIVHNCVDFDFVWLWPHFLENIQKHGFFRGFGLDYDYRKFETPESETTTYLKMQLWGGQNTKRIYEILQNDSDFKNKVVLSKVRFKQMGDESDPNAFAIQDVKYNGKFTTRGTDFNTHLYTLNDVRKQYRNQIVDIEQRYSLRWVNKTNGNTTIEGYAIHYLPVAFELPVSLLVDKLFDGTEPFRLIGFPNFITPNSAVLEVVDLHTGGKFSIDIYPDVMTVYLPEHTCGNTIARLYTNLQHSFNVNFKVETDNGDQLFN